MAVVRGRILGRLEHQFRLRLQDFVLQRVGLRVADFPAVDLGRIGQLDPIHLRRAEIDRDAFGNPAGDLGRERILARLQTGSAQYKAGHAEAASDPRSLQQALASVFGDIVHGAVCEARLQHGLRVE